MGEAGQADRGGDVQHLGYVWRPAGTRTGAAVHQPTRACGTGSGGDVILAAARIRGALCLRSNIATVARWTDTTGAVYGQIAGAYYGVEGIPEKWRHKLAEL